MTKTTHIRPAGKYAFVNFSEVIQSKDLLIGMTIREILTPYRQSIFGIGWFILIPIISSLVYTFIFGKMAQLSTDGQPQFLFYLCGTICWAMFADSFNRGAAVFMDNSALFGKVYFPRIIPLISRIIVNFIRFLVQLFILMVAIGYYVMFFEYQLEISVYALAFITITVLLLGFNAMAFGMFYAALSSKYRDFTLVLGFLSQMWMFLTPVVYPLSVVSESLRFLMAFNPLTPIFELFRFSVLGVGSFSISMWVISISISVFVFILGGWFFSRVEKTIIDIV